LEQPVLPERPDLPGRSDRLEPVVREVQLERLEPLASQESWVLRECRVNLVILDLPELMERLDRWDPLVGLERPDRPDYQE